MFAGYYPGKRALVTGHTGFKGSWLALWLRHLGAQVFGYGWPPPTQPNLCDLTRQPTFAREFEGDIRDRPSLEEALTQSRPQILFHLAAQSLVRQSYADPIETFSINALGTAQLLDAVRRTNTRCTVIVVTSDKCYENRGWNFGYREDDSLGGHDVYSMSKGAAELVTAAWRRSFFLPNPGLGPVASVRAGNVIGGGDYAADRLVPDCVRALMAKRPIEIRNPAATRPWQHVLDCLSGYLWLGAQLASVPSNSPFAGPFNFGPGPQGVLSVADVVRTILRLWPGEWRDVSSLDHPHEATQLELSISKASRLLNWQPTWDLESALRHTIEWYRQRHEHRRSDMAEFSRAQLEIYSTDARARGIAWAQPSTS